jgi:exodeoxyribonuclease X
MKILICDVETTGLTSTDEIVEIAWVEVDDTLTVLSEFQSLVKPTVPINAAASAASHITDAMVADAPSIEEVLAGFPEDHFANVFAVCHNLQFDRRFLSKHWQVNGGYCTLRAAKSIYREAPNHKLQTLRYFLGLDVEGGAHRAMQDVVTTYELLARILEDSGMSLPDLLETGDRPVLVERIGFGKHRGMRLEELPVGYRKWLLFEAEIDQDLRWSLSQLRSNADERTY